MVAVFNHPYQMDIIKKVNTGQLFPILLCLKWLSNITETRKEQFQNSIGKSKTGAISVRTYIHDCSLGLAFPWKRRGY